MTHTELLNKLDQVEKIAKASKFKRMLMFPYKYLNAILFRELFYKRTLVEKKVSVETFFGTQMNLLLPSSTDIYLAGGKTHDSELGLAKFLIKYLNEGDTFIDVGAHYGYFSLLASKIVGNSGKTYSFEASPFTFRILDQNTTNISNIQAFNLAITDENKLIQFFEFPNLYSEYNSMDISQFKNEKWFSKYNPKEISIKGIFLDEFLLQKKVVPDIIKIDVEGAEYKVIKGSKGFLSLNSPYIVLEYLSNKRGNEEHKAAENLLISLGYSSYIILEDGHLKQINGIGKYLDDLDLESDNIVFFKNIKV